MAKILIVDDNRDIADSIADVLTDAGHNISVAYGGHDAIAKAAEEKPQAVLLDIGMPVIDGIEVARQLRLMHGTQVRIVAYTGYTGTAIEQRIREASFDAILRKPEKLDVIVDALTDASAGKVLHDR